MFTQCPDCERQFRIRADQLTAAAGQVKCGFCGSQFNALLRLRDQPVPPGPADSVGVDPAVAEATEEESQSSGAHLPSDEPQFSLPGDLEFQIGEQDPRPSLADHEPLPGDVPVAVPEVRVDETGAEADSEADTLPGEEPDLMPRYDFPADYLEETPPEPGRRSRVLWGLGSILLMSILILQAGWFYRDQVLNRYPHLTPYVKQLCARVDCRITRYPRVNEIQLLNRDVRNHPRYEDSLLVNATMINQAQNVQPFPRIRLSLFDTNGRVISWRLFQPREYLDGSIDVEAGMNAGVPVHFVLEVTGPTRGAVSFEFDFLEG